MSDVAEIVVHGRHVEVSKRFREHVHNKLDRIDKFGIPLRRVDVEVSKEANPRLADRAFEVELTTRANGAVIRAEAAASDKYAALDIAYGRLEQRLRRAADKNRFHRHGADAVRSPRAAGFDNLGPRGRGAGTGGRSRRGHGLGAGAGRRAREEPRDRAHVRGTSGDRDGDGRARLLLVHRRDSGDPVVVYRRRGFDYGLIRVHTADEAQPAEESA